MMTSGAITGCLVEGVNLVTEPNEVVGNIMIVVVGKRALSYVRANLGHVGDGAGMKVRENEPEEEWPIVGEFDTSVVLQGCVELVGNGTDDDETEDSREEELGAILTKAFGLVGKCPAGGSLRPNNRFFDLGEIA